MRFPAIPETLVGPADRPGDAEVNPPVLVPAAGALVRHLPAAASGPRRELIVEADDLGLLYAFNEGVRAAFHEGVLTSACLRANGYAFDHAIAEVLKDCPGLGVGVHLCLNEAEPVSAAGRITALLDGHGRLRSGYLWIMRAARTRSALVQIEREFRAQIERVLAAGVRPDHLNSHQHVHMIPPLFRLTCRLAREYDVPAVRLVRELPYWAGGLRQQFAPLANSNFAKHLLLNRFARINEGAARCFSLPVTDYFIGVSYTANMHLAAVLNGLRAAAYGAVEILLHPAIGPDARDRRYPSQELQQYVAAHQRRIELASLRAPELSDFLQRAGWLRLRFGDWARLRRERRITMSDALIPPADHELCDQTAVHCPPWVSAAHPDSRAFSELALANSAAGQRVLDLGTGTGIIAICLAKRGRVVVASDVSGSAVRTARENARRNGVMIECHESDLLATVPGRFDLIAFNIPYGFGPDNLATSLAKHVLRKLPFIRRRSGLAMPRPVLRYHQELIARLGGQAREHLQPGGALLLHVYESEVDALMSVLPRDVTVELLRHPALAPNRTLGMLVRYPAVGVVG